MAKRALLIGLGAGSLAKYFYYCLPDCKTTVIEISPEVLTCANQHFKLPEQNKQFRVIIDDGFDYVQKAINRTTRYDLILVDGFDHKARAGALDSVPFYQTCRALLSDNGMLSVNLFGAHRGFANSFANIRDCFDGRAIALPASEGGNIIVLAASGQQIETSLDAMQEQATQLLANSGLDLHNCIKKIAKGNWLQDGVLRI